MDGNSQTGRWVFFFDFFDLGLAVDKAGAFGGRAKFNFGTCFGFDVSANSA